MSSHLNVYMRFKILMNVLTCTWITLHWFQLNLNKEILTCIKASGVLPIAVNKSKPILSIKQLNNLCKKKTTHCYYKCNRSANQAKRKKYLIEQVAKQPKKTSCLSAIFSDINRFRYVYAPRPCDCGYISYCKIDQNTFAPIRIIVGKLISW